MANDLKISSGGQTGVDRAALEWALAKRVPHGGWCPRGCRAEDGPIPRRFKLRETASDLYIVRTRRNVLACDGTVIFTRRKRLSGGTAATARFARTARKPLLCLVSSMQVRLAAAKLRAFLVRHRITKLNVAGPRASEEPDLGDFVKAVLSQALTRRN